MYELPSVARVSKVIIDEAAIKGESQPIVVYENQQDVDINEIESVIN